MASATLGAADDNFLDESDVDAFQRLKAAGDLLTKLHASAHALHANGCFWREADFTATKILNAAKARRRVETADAHADR